MKYRDFQRKNAGIQTPICMPYEPFFVGDGGEEQGQWRWKGKGPGVSERESRNVEGVSNKFRP